MAKEKLTLFEWNLKLARDDIMEYLQELKDLEHDKLITWYQNDIIALVNSDDFSSEKLIEDIFNIYKPKISRIITEEERYFLIKQSFIKVATN